jgi:hypothetical protein
MKQRYLPNLPSLRPGRGIDRAGDEWEGQGCQLEGREIEKRPQEKPQETRKGGPLTLFLALGRFARKCLPRIG